MAENPQAEQKIRWVYHWLRWSSFITVPWMGFNWLLVESLFYPTTSWGYAVAVLLPALAHLVLLLGFRSPSLYARRHTQQAFMLVGLRVNSALFFVALGQGSYACLWIIVSGFLWVWGSTWGLRQINRGDCWLMKWNGENDELPRPWAVLADAAASTADVPEPLSTDVPTATEPKPKLTPTPKPAATSIKATPLPAVHLPSETSADPNVAFEEGLRLLSTDKRTKAIDCFLAAFRAGPPDLRSRALAELEKLGEVETF